MPTPLARLFGRGRHRHGGDRGHGLRLAAALAESDRPLRVLRTACRLALRHPSCDVALLGLRRSDEGGPSGLDWVAGGCLRRDRRLLQEALDGRHSPLPAVGAGPLWIRLSDDPFQPGTAVLRPFGLAWALVLPGAVAHEGRLRRGVLFLAGADRGLQPDHPLIRDARLIWLASREHLATAPPDDDARRLDAAWPAAPEAWLEAPAALAVAGRDGLRAVNRAADRLLVEHVGGHDDRREGWLLGAVRRLEISGRTRETVTASLGRGRSLAVALGSPFDADGARLVSLHAAAEPAQESADREAELRMLGHELRTPLTAMRTSLDLVLRGETGPLTAGQERFLGTARRNLERLNRLLGDLLEARQAVAGRPAVDPQAVDLGALLHDELAMLAVVCREKGLALETGGLPGSFRACVDADKVQQMVHNVVGNAIKYTASGGVVAVSLQERLEAAPGAGPQLARYFGLPLDVFTLTVADSGLGMSEAFLATIFQPFNREDRAETRRLPGAGLGLHITRGLVEAHGGLIRIASAPGRGTTVDLVLPREPESGRVLSAGRQLAALHDRALAAGLPASIVALDMRDRLDRGRPWEGEAATEQALAFLARLGRESADERTAAFARSAGSLGWTLAPGLCCGLALDAPRLAAAWQVASAAPESVALLDGSGWRSLEEMLAPAAPVAPPQPAPPASPGPRPEPVGA